MGTSGRFLNGLSLMIFHPAMVDSDSSSVIPYLMAKIAQHVALYFLSKGWKPKMDHSINQRRSLGSAGIHCTMNGGCDADVIDISLIYGHY